ncbi:hypothetical protein ACSTJP_00080, partial [Vibrio parahaemolyticus]
PYKIQIIGLEAFQPQGIAVDRTGAVYVSDANRNKIFKYANGAISAIAGTGQSGFSGDCGPATQAQLNTPGAL